MDCKKATPTFVAAEMSLPEAKLLLDTYLPNVLTSGRLVYVSLATAEGQKRCTYKLYGLYDGSFMTEM